MLETALSVTLLNLIIHHGWSRLLIDGNESLVRGRELYGGNRFTYVYPPVFVHSWITRRNVNEVIRTNGFEGEIDLLSIDMDGMEYWIWDALEPSIQGLSWLNTRI